MTDPNPNRLAGSPALGEPALGLAPVAVVERSPTGLALLPQMLVKIAAVVVGLAAVGLTVVTVLPPTPLTAQIQAICLAVVGVGATLGIASPGARSGVGTQPVTLAAPPPNPSAPRVGPPV